MVRVTYRDWLRSIHSVTRATTQSLKYSGPKGLVPSGTPVVVSPGGSGVVATASTEVAEGDQIGLIVSDRVATGSTLNAAVLFHGTVNFDKLPAAAQALIDMHRPAKLTVIRKGIISPYTERYTSTY